MTKIYTRHTPLIYEIDDNVIFSSRGETIVAYRIEYKEKYTLNHEDFERIHGDWIRALSLLPTGTIVQKSDWYEKSRYDSSALSKDNFLQRSTAEYFQEREYIAHNGYIFLVMPCGVYERSQAGNPFRIPSVRKMQDHDIKKQRFLEAAELMREMLERSGDIKLKAMTQMQIEEYERVYLNGFNKDNLVDLVIGKESVSAGNRQIGIMAVTNERYFPGAVYSSIEDRNYSGKADDFIFFQGMMDDITFSLEFSHIYNQVIIIDDHRNHVKKLESNLRDMIGARRFSTENQRGVDELKGYLDETISNPQSRYIRGHSNIIYWSDDSFMFENATRNIQSILRTKDFIPYRGTGAGLKSLFLNSLPMNISCMEKNMFYLVDISVATALFVNNSNYKNAQEGIILNERMFNIPVKFDFWDSDRKMITSRNFAIVAPTGKGKSFTANHIFRQLVEDGIILVIIDLGDSYLKLSRLLPAEDTLVLRYKEGEPLGLNPFLLDGAQLTPLKIEEICEFIWTLIKRENEPTQAEMTSMRKIVSHYYSNVDDNHSWASFYSFIKLNGSGLYYVLGIEDQSFFDLSEFLHVGSDFIADGIYSNLLGTCTDNSASFKDKKLIIFELDEIKDNRLLLTIMLQVISEAIQKTIWSDRKNRGIVFFDEFAKQLEFPEVTRRVKYYSQAIRKQNGGVGIVLQTLNQLPDTPEGKSILDNTETFIFLESSNYEDSISRLKLNSHDRSQLMSLKKKFDGDRKYSEIYVKRGSYGNVYRIEVAPELYLAYQTEGEKHTDIMELYEKYESMEMAIQAYMKR